jgi:hypothetical protein
MRRIRILASAFIAALALGAVMSAMASAAMPEWGRCVPLTGKGKYTNPSCTGEKVKKGGGWEWDPGSAAIANRNFVSHGGEAELTTTIGIATVCTSEEAHGTLTGIKEVVGVEVTFQGCHANLLGLICTGGEIEEFEEGVIKEKPGEIKTRSLKGKLGYISGKGTEHPVVGISLTPEAGSKTLFAQFICGGILVVRVGTKPSHGGGDSIIGEITPVDQMGSEATQTYTQQQECFVEEEVEHCRNTGVQNPLKFEEGKNDFLETEISDNFGEIPWTQSGQTLTTVNQLEEEVEIRA